MLGLGRLGQRLDHVGQQRVECRARLGTAQVTNGLAPMCGTFVQALAMLWIERLTRRNGSRRLVLFKQPAVALRHLPAQ